MRVRALSAMTRGSGHDRGEIGDDPCPATGSGSPAPRATAEAAAVVSAIRGDAQSAPVSQPFPTPLTVEVTDELGNPTPGRSVSFAVTAGSASFSGSPSLLVLTDSVGGASATLTAGTTPGEVSVTATVTGLPAVGFVQTVEASSPTRADLAVAVTVPTSLASRGTGTVSVAVTNAGPQAASPVLGAVRLPTELAVTSSSPAGAQRVGSTLLFRTSTLAAGEGVTYAVGVRNMTRNRKIVSVFAAALSPVKDPRPSNNTATADIRLD